jgi:hypothetical protein
MSLSSISLRTTASSPWPSAPTAERETAPRPVRAEIRVRNRRQCRRRSACSADFQSISISRNRCSLGECREGALTAETRRAQRLQLSRNSALFAVQIRRIAHFEQDFLRPLPPRFLCALRVSALKYLLRLGLRVPCTKPLRLIGRSALVAAGPRCAVSPTFQSADLTTGSGSLLREGMVCGVSQVRRLENLRYGRLESLRYPRSQPKSSRQAQSLGLE